MYLLQVFAILGSIGSVGHFLTLCVLQRSAFAGRSTTILLRALAVADTVALLSMVHYLSIIKLPRFQYVLWVTSIASSWTIVLISVERVVIIYTPLQARTLCTKKRAICAVVALWFMVAFISSVQFPLSSNQNKSVYRTFYGFLPGVIILVCNVSILVKLCAVKSERKQLAPDTATSKTDSLTVMLIINTLSFICLVIPPSIMTTMYFHYNTWRVLFLYYTLGRTCLYLQHCSPQCFRRGDTLPVSPAAPYTPRNVRK